MKSELGSRAAWKGFSSQTVYIAYRLMLLNNEYDFFPEQAEDLMIKKNDKVVELVQVKNLSADLALSHLSPKEKDSFFQRCLKLKNDSSEEIILNIVSFGTIGEEIKKFCDSVYSSKLAVATKLKSYGYIEEDIQWIHRQLKIERVDEKDLLFKIHQNLESAVRTMAAPYVAFDVLINYIYNLSRTGAHTSKQLWNQKLDRVAMDFSAVSGMVKQFGQTIFPIYEYNDIYDHELLHAEYSAGINALPQHIRANLDFPRKKWNDIIEDAFLSSNIVVIRGVSGQGKSTIAYRFLIEHYLERDIICIEKVLSEEQAIDISAALQSMARERKSTLAVCLDVGPYDTSWLWICEQLSAHGANLKLIITIREEDFRRATIDYSKHRFVEVELYLFKEEAQEIFTRYPSANFLSFEEAWDSFGEDGPFMEFAYMLNQQGTLREKLRAQIDRITQQEIYADEWLQILEVVSYVGKYNLKVSASTIFEKLSCPQRRKMLTLFEKEYFLRESKDKQYLESLHALRANILYDILKEQSLISEFDTLKLSLQLITDTPLMLVVEFLQKNSMSFDIVKSLAKINYNSWSVYAGVLKAVLWGEVYSYYWKNKNVIDKGNELINNFIMFGITDVTGYLKDIDSSAFVDIWKRRNPSKYQDFLDLKAKLESKALSYEYLDLFITESSSTLPLDTIMRAEDVTAMGFCLYWFSIRDYLLPEPTFESVLPSMNSTNLEDYLNLLVGLSYQNWLTIYNRLRTLAEKIIISQLGIVYCEVTNEVTVHAIYNILECEDTDFNRRILRVVDAIRKLYPKKQMYNVEMIGFDIIDNIELPSSKKNIPIENLPLVWVTQLNRWLLSIDNYIKAPTSWDIVNDEIMQIKADIITSVDLIIKGVDYLYSKQSIKKLNDNMTLKSIKRVNEKLASYTFPTPQCALDQYGIKLNNAIVDRTNGDLQLNSIPSKEKKQFKSLWNNFCNSYLSFLSKMNDVLVSKIMRKVVPDEGRLSLINLITAYQEINDLEIRYKTELNKYGCEFFTSEERNRILLLTAVWSRVYNLPLHKTNSLSYDCNKYLRNYSNRLKEFFFSDISKLDGVISQQNNGKEIKMLVDSEQVEFICRELFIKFKKAFKEISRLTLEESIFKDYVQCVDIIVCFKGQPLPGGYLIENMRFVIYEELDKFMSMFAPSTDTHGIILEESPKTAAIKIFADLYALPMLFKHIIQVNNTVLILNSNESYIVSTYNSWLSSTTDYFVKILTEIESSLNLIRECRGIPENMDIERYEEILLNVISDLKKNAREVLVYEDGNEILELVSKLEGNLVTLIDLYPTEIFQ
ncbi:hypothetical protein BSK66_29370 [Paenibacillus odorifer]|uniref:Uncharacterized protein n=2 Tax=Paenibacillus TaxID=44249 RepID=A0A1R0X3B6_9BACL|nr:hypothetical protein [Paenibacillus odorifer]ETT67435.1 hypothetical protein C171_03530 [Paenibacillus sp. FSL H8-237]OMD27895.1 hypothetical protein BJP51_01940 [Paenibacillus odorifer]OME47978.1 hypothetical protein BSK66_29370 [Paenibacillus odorifer]